MSRCSSPDLETIEAAKTLIAMSRGETFAADSETTITQSSSESSEAPLCSRVPVAESETTITRPFSATTETMVSQEHPSDYSSHSTENVTSPLVDLMWSRMPINCIINRETPMEDDVPMRDSPMEDDIVACDTRMEGAAPSIEHPEPVESDHRKLASQSTSEAERAVESATPSPRSVSVAPSVVEPVDVIVERTDKAEIDAEIAIHNQRITDFLAHKAKPDYTEDDLNQFKRDWVQSYCVKRRIEGHPKIFTCSSHLLNGKTCDTAQEYSAFSLSRAGVSHFFGHNKMEWLQVPSAFRVVICRKHYQTGVYRGIHHAKPTDANSFQSIQMKLIRAQVAKLREWRPDATFDIQPTKPMQVRIAQYHKLVSQGEDRETAAAKINAMRSGNANAEPKAEEKTRVEFVLAFDAAYGRQGVDFEGVRAAIDHIEEQMRFGGLKHLPAVECLLQLRREDQLRHENGKIAWTARASEMMGLPTELKRRRLVYRNAEDEDDEAVVEKKIPKLRALTKRKRVDIEAAEEAKKRKMT